MFPIRHVPPGLLVLSVLGAVVAAGPAFAAESAGGVMRLAQDAGAPPPPDDRKDKDKDKDKNRNRDDRREERDQRGPKAEQGGERDKRNGERFGDGRREDRQKDRVREDDTDLRRAPGFSGPQERGKPDKDFGRQPSFVPPQARERDRRDDDDRDRKVRDRERSREERPANVAPPETAPAAADTDQPRNRDRDNRRDRDLNSDRTRDATPPVRPAPVEVPASAPKPEDDRQRDRNRDRARNGDGDAERLREVAPPATVVPPAVDQTRNLDRDRDADRRDRPNGQWKNGDGRKDARYRRPRPEDIRQSFAPPPKPKFKLDDVKRSRKETVTAGGAVRLIQEEDRRVIVKQDNRVFIRHDETDRFRRLSPNARTIKRLDGSRQTVVIRRDGVRIYDVADRNGRLLHRYRRYPDGREVVLIDNRRFYRDERHRTRDILIGAGIGLVIGSAIALAEPRIDIPRDDYIVDYDRASDEDLYDALIAPPVERLDRAYSLDEVRYSAPLRDRMRRVDLDTVTFDFGSWEVMPDQERALARMADAINRVLDRNPDEIFLIEGHTDAVGSNEDNLTLSDRRAQSVAEILTTAYGVPPENLITQGYGEEYLKVPTEEPNRANRRIVVRRISPLLAGEGEGLRD